MNRREALKYSSGLLGMSFIGAEVFISGCANDEADVKIITDEDVLLLDEIGETILPDSDRSPGAKAAKIGRFMQNMVSDCYTEKEQNIFKAGLKIIRQSCLEKYDADFFTMQVNERETLLTEFDKEAGLSTADSPHFYIMIKQLTIWGYFTSEVGATQALRYDPAPGYYDGCVDYKEGDKAWFGFLSSIG